MQEYLHVEAHLGRAPRRRAVGAAGRVLLGRVRPARVDADLLGRPRHPRRRSHQGASDLGIPLVGVGLYYDQGYFRQRLDRDGWQHEDYIDVDSRLLPIEPATRADGTPVTDRDRDAHGHASRRASGRLTVGRNTLLLLDSDVDGNQPEDRELTARLYGGDERVRIRQELLLGVGGVRALRRAGHPPGRRAPERRPQRVCRARAGAAAHGRPRASTPTRRSAASSAQVVFTTHTPVPAGHDRFSPDLVDEHLGPLREALGLEPRRLDGARPRRPAQRPGETFCMTVLALKLSRRANAVSSLHGQVSRAMWTPLFPRPPRKTTCRSATSPTASTSAPGSRRRCARSTTAISAPDWPQRARRAGLLGSDRRTSTTASCGRRIRR